MIPAIIAQAQDVLQGRLTVAGLELRGEEITTDWREMLFTPEVELEDHCRPDHRHQLGSSRLSFEEERAVREMQLDDLGRDIANRVYQEAASEAVAALVEHATASPYHSFRLRARICLAIREELAALVADWNGLVKVEGEEGDPDPGSLKMNTPTLQDLDGAKLLRAAECLLAGVDPSSEDIDCFSRWIYKDLFAPSKPLTGWKAFEPDPEEEAKLADDPERQRETLERAIRELLAALKTVPTYENHRLTMGLLQLYRRELIWLLGRWVELDGVGGEL